MASALLKTEYTHGLTLFSPLGSLPAVSEAVHSNGSSSFGEDRWDQLLTELSRFRDLEDDWDGQGAAALEHMNVESAITWVEHMRGDDKAEPPNRVVAGVAGEVYLVWQESGFLLEAEISKPDQVEWLLAVDGQPTRQWKTDNSTLWLVGRVS